jgi:hypothetical protein
MKVLNHGSTYKEDKDPPKYEKFKCEKCGCRFSCEEDEYYTDYGTCWPTWTCGSETITTSATIVNSGYSSTATDILVCSCPECHKIVKKTKTRTVYNPSITLTGTGDKVAFPKYDVTCSSEDLASFNTEDIHV